MKQTKRLSHRELIQIGEYLITGGAYFWTGYLVFLGLDKGLGWTLWWAKLAANVSGWVVNYVLQRYWVFNNPKLRAHQTEVTGRYAIITLANFVLDYFIVFALQQAGLTPYLGQFVSSGFFTFWNYAWYKFWVFPQRFAKKPRQRRVTLPRAVAHHAHGPSAYHPTKRSHRGRR